MDLQRKLAAFEGRIVMVGFGSIGQATLPLLLRHLQVQPEQLRIVIADDDGAAIAAAHGVPRVCSPITPGSVVPTLGPLVGAGDVLLNLSVDVCSVDLIEFARRRGALYLDTSTEPWPGGYVDRHLSPEERTNHALREAALALRTPRRDAPTALITHGANPGLVSHFVKQALLDLAAEAGGWSERPREAAAWARLARWLGVRAIHIAECDTQVARQPRAAGEFVNTWSVDGLVSEASQPAELGWGTHERHFPPDAHRPEGGTPASIWLARPGASTRVRSWTPLAGPMQGLLITHAEAISIADFLTLGDPTAPEYRPTVHYAYRPCDDALLSLHDLAGREWAPPERRRVIKDEIVHGVDELGVLLLGPGGGGYWYGSRLSIAQARALVPHNSATSLQVAAAVLAGIVWLLRNPRRDIVEPDELPFDEILEIARPYLGDLVGVRTTWTPLQGRERLFDEELDRDDPWQFINVRVG